MVGAAGTSRGGRRRSWWRSSSTRSASPTERQNCRQLAALSEERPVRGPHLAVLVEEPFGGDAGAEHREHEPIEWDAGVRERGAEVHGEVDGRDDQWLVGAPEHRW